MGVDVRPGEPFVNTESFLSRFVLRQEGHAGTAAPLTRVSKPLRHSLQTYSNIGMP